MTTYTKGPWTYWKHADRFGKGQDCFEIGDLDLCKKLDCDGDAFAYNENDARLIAAAPELLEVLKQINEELFNWNVRTVPKAEVVQRLWELSSTAINKATGKE